jgi:hypothetical protein
MRKIFWLTMIVLVAVAMPQIVMANTIYAIDGINHEIVMLDGISGAELGRIPTPEISSGGPDGLAASGSSVFFVNGSGTNQIYTIDTTTGTVTDTSPSPSGGWGTDGLAVTNGMLFSLEPTTDTIYWAPLDTKIVAGSCVTGILAVGSLAAENGRLFTTIGLNTIVELNPDTCEEVGARFPVPGADFTFGLAFDGERLYTGRIIEPGFISLDPDTGEIIGEFVLEFAPPGLAASSMEDPPVSSHPLLVDIRPGSDRNVLNVKSRGRIPVAVYGSEADDIGAVDLSSLTLAGVPAVHSAFEDVDGDGVLDLILHFKTQALVQAMQSGDSPFENGQTMELALSGEFQDGTPCSGSDMVTLLGAGDNRSRRRGVDQRAERGGRGGGR